MHRITFDTMYNLIDDVKELTDECERMGADWHILRYQEEEANACLACMTAAWDFFDTAQALFISQYSTVENRRILSDHTAYRVELNHFTDLEKLTDNASRIMTNWEAGIKQLTDAKQTAPDFSFVEDSIEDAFDSDINTLILECEHVARTINEASALRETKQLAVCMALHPRLGEKSWLQQLDPELVFLIAKEIDAKVI